MCITSMLGGALILSKCKKALATGSVGVLLRQRKDAKLVLGRVDPWCRVMITAEAMVTKRQRLQLLDGFRKNG